jgi:hypothetical protein
MPAACLCDFHQQRDNAACDAVHLQAVCRMCGCAGFLLELLGAGLDSRGCLGWLSGGFATRCDRMRRGSGIRRGRAFLWCVAWGL